MQLLRKFLNALFPLADFLYILQLEEYNHRRYLVQVKRRFFKRNFQKRGKLQWTTRVKLICGAFFLLTAALTPFFASVAIVIGYFLTLLIFLPYVLVIPSLVVSPLIFYIRSRRLRRTAAYFATTYPNTKVIGITGSYGKTTTKYALLELLKYSFKTEIVPDNINTTLGISEYLHTHHIPLDTEYLIVEMGAYEQGDIKEAATMLPPDIAILTCLGDQHLERFGSQQNLISGKNELFQYAKPNALKFADVSTVNKLKDAHRQTNQIFTVEHTDATANLALATAVAQELGVTETLIAEALKSFTPPDRRNATYELEDVTIIDNSYNISPQTADFIVKNAAEIAKQQDKRLVVLTAGIAEQGTDSQLVNEQFGRLLNQHADRVIVLPSLYAPYITNTASVEIQHTEFALTVLHNLSEFVDAETEVLLQLPEHTDLVYF